MEGRMMGHICLYRWVQKPEYSHVQNYHATWLNLAGIAKKK